MTEVLLAAELNGKTLPRAVYASGGVFYCWEQGKPGAPLLPTHILWHIDYSDSLNLKGYAKFLDFTGSLDLGYGGGLFPAVPGRTLAVDVAYNPGAEEGPHGLTVTTDSDAVSEASSVITASNAKEVSFQSRKLDFTPEDPEKNNRVRSLYTKTVLAEGKGIFSGDPVFSLTAEDKRRVHKAVSAENGRLYFLSSDGRISDNIRTAIRRAAIGLPSGEWLTINRTLYVKYDLASGANDGTSPDNAYRGAGCLTAALTDAKGKSVLLREPVQILVAGGTYPQENLWGVNYRIRVYGGFNSDFTVRDFNATPTVLDGEGTASGQVVLSGEAIVDGLTVCNLSAALPGSAGLAVDISGNATLSRCVIVDNTLTSGNGTAVDFRGGKVINCYFENNAGTSSIYWTVSTTGSIINSVLVGDNISIYSFRNSVNIINCTMIDDGSRPSDPWIGIGVYQAAPYNINIRNTVIYGTDAAKRNFRFPEAAATAFPINITKSTLRGGVSGLNLYSSGTFYDIGEMVYTLSAGVYTSYYCIQAGFNHTPASSPAYWRVVDETEVLSWWDPQLDADYTPLPGSPCVDAGDITAYTDVTSPAYGLSTDFYDNPRYKTDGGGVPVSVDIGAVQRQD